MTIPENKERPAQTAADPVANPDKIVSDASLEQIAGGTTNIEDWPPCTTADELDQEERDAVESSIRLNAGSDVPVVDK